MQDKLEFGLKVLWDRDVDDPRDRERGRGHPPAEERDLRPEGLDLLRAHAVRPAGGRAPCRRAPSATSREIFEQLRDVSVASRANKPIGDKMIMNAAFLVARDKEAAFDAKVKQIGARYDKLTFKYTGPWPPYNFVNIRLKLERRARRLSQRRVLILDSLLIGGITFVLDKVAAGGRAEMNDDTALREELLAAQMRLELGEISEEEFARDRDATCWPASARSASAARRPRASPADEDRGRGGELRERGRRAVEDDEPSADRRRRR